MKGEFSVYASYNYPTKKSMKEDAEKLGAGRFMVYQPGPFGSADRPIAEGETVTLEGPHYPEPHKWYATVTRKGDKLVVK